MAREFTTTPDSTQTQRIPTIAKLRIVNALGPAIVLAPATRAH